MNLYHFKNKIVLLVLSLLGGNIYAYDNFIFSELDNTDQENSIESVHVMQMHPDQAMQIADIYTNTRIMGRAVDNPGFPGLIKAEDYPNTCFTYMGQVEFRSRFISPDWAAGASNYSNSTYAPNLAVFGFSIPLVADLDGDGYPEVITITQTLNSTAGYFRGIKIIDGRTAKPLATLNFKNTANNNLASVYSSGYHASPSLFALAKIPDLKGSSAQKGEENVTAVFAFPAYAYTATYNNLINKLAAYEIIPTKDSAGNTTGYTWQERWISANTYNDGQTNYHKPMTTIVNMQVPDGSGGSKDGPVVVVYNKIYNAADGALLLTLDRALPNNTGTADWGDAGPFIGKDAGSTWGGGYDYFHGFNYIYDLDLDGRYDIVAGGRVYYNIDPVNKTYDKVTCKTSAGVIIPDGRTGVADINGDGIPEVVVVKRINQTNIRVIVYNPGFLFINANGEVERIPDGQTPVPTILADQQFQINTNATAQGSNSYVYIGDIDGTESQIILGGKSKKVRLPEIAFISGSPQNEAAWNNIPKIDNSFPAYNGLTSRIQGLLYAFTFDDSSAANDGSEGILKLAFALEHADRSINTGFTMFDFDNDGAQEICYRDETTLRIIKTSKQRYVKLNDTTSTLISASVNSFTGYEYPVIADLDNDNSADMAVTGRQGVNSGDNTDGYISIVSFNSDKFAPALPVWNQFMYDPFKINPDLTVPTGPAPNRLSKDYTFNRVLRNNAGEITGIIEDFQPYNASIVQAGKYRTGTVIGTNADDKSIITVENAYDPLIFLTEAYVYNEKTTDIAKKPTIITEGSGAAARYYVQFTLGNKASSQTAISPTTPITVYRDAVSATSPYISKKTLSDLGLTQAISAGQEIQLKMQVDKKYGFYILRVGDDSPNASNNITSWSFGANDQTILDQIGNDSVVNEMGYGVARMAFRDCNWEDQVLKASLFLLSDDYATTLLYGSTIVDVETNDIYPEDFDKNLKLDYAITKPEYGVLTIENNKFVYTNTKPIPGGGQFGSIDKFVYERTYKDPSTNENITMFSTAYIYVVQSETNSFAACYGDEYTVKLVNGPDKSNIIYEDSNNNSVTPPIVIASLTVPVSYTLTPDMSEVTRAWGYENIFPSVELTIYPIGSSMGEIVELKWTGIFDKNWANPQNWNLVTNGVETTATYAPTTCTDVEIPNVSSASKNYPEIQTIGANDINNFILRSKAMVKNLQRIASKSVRFSLDITQGISKWIMYTPPLTEAYKADFNYTRDGEQGSAIYINQFDPTYAPDFVGYEKGAFVAMGKDVSKPLSNPASALKPFMLYINQGPIKYSLPVTTPNLNALYVNSTGDSPVLLETDRYTIPNRSSAHFIYENYLSGDRETATVTYSSADGAQYMVISNIFPCYINIEKLLADNTSLNPNLFLVWDGKDENVIRRPNYVEKGWRLSSSAVLKNVTTVDTSEKLIAPFQSVIVKKANPSTTTVNIIYNADNITTVGDGTDYIL